MITNPEFYLTAIPAVLIIGLSKGGFGGGLALLGVPLMSLTMPTFQAAAILLPILIVMDMVGLFAYRGKGDIKSLLILVPAAIAGIILGWATASWFSDALIRLCVGIVALVFVIDYWIKRIRAHSSKREILPTEHNVIKGSVWGMLSGFTSFIAHAGGPPYQVYMLPLQQDKIRFAATAAYYFAILNAVKVIPYLMLNQFSTENIQTTLVLLPLAPIATFAGVWLVKRISQNLFYLATYVAITVVSVKLIMDGLFSIEI